MPLLAPLLTAYLVLVGLMLGSFINLVADRLPRAESVITPASHCRACGRRLNVIDLLPVAGYLVRRGRCATCSSRIGATAPVVEAVAGLCMAVAIVWLSLWPGAVVGLGFVAAWGAAVTVLSMRRNRG